jgi:hypothetical protein
LAENTNQTNMAQRMARIAISMGAMALWLNAATAQNSPSALNGGGSKLQRALVTAWQALNEDCRGGHGDDPATDKACDRRTVISTQLGAQGCRYHMGDYWTCTGSKRLN